MNAVLPRTNLPRLVAYPFDHFTFSDSPLPLYTQKIQKYPFASLRCLLYPSKNTGSTPVTRADSTPPSLSPLTSVSELPESHAAPSSKPAYKEKTLLKNKQRPTPFTPGWVLRRLRNDILDEGRATLQNWIPFKRRKELSDDLLHQILDLSDDLALQAI